VLVAHISGRIHVAAPCELVFDTVADSRNEPSFNPAMHDVRLLTAPPVGLGSRFSARMGRAGTELLVDITEFDRPHRLGSRTSSTLMTTAGSLTFTPAGEGTDLAWDWQVRPRGWLRGLGPVVGMLGSRMERGIWTGLKNELEGLRDDRRA